MRTLATLLIVAASACSLFTSLDDFTTDDIEPGADATDGDADGAVPPGEDASDDGPLLADADGPLVVDGGCVRRPISAFNATPAGSDSVTCGVTNILELDGVFAGLDQSKYSGAFVPLAGESVQACVGARFDEDIGPRIVVHAATLQNACGSTCGYNDGECRNKQTIKVFSGSSEEALQFLDMLFLTHDDAGAKVYSVIRPPASGVRVVVVCRGGDIDTRDLSDVGIDFVEADCP